MIQIYSAPLEGITGFAYRNAHRAHFTGIEKYYTPFLAPNYTHHLKTREREDILPENNGGVPLVPQILTNRAGDFLWAAEELYDYGYREINLNLGCPMPTVVKKHRGSGQLGDLDELDRFLNEICDGMDRRFGLKSGDLSDSKDSEQQAFAKETSGGTEPGKGEFRIEGFDKADSGKGEFCVAGFDKADSGKGEFCEAGFDKADSDKGEFRKADSGKEGSGKLSFSIKTRIGLDSADNAADLLKIYNRYPISELIVHPRTRKDLYGGKPDLETFAMFLEESLHPVVYNGDIFTVDDFERIRGRFPECGTIMLGRGLIANPALAREIRGGSPLEKGELRKFHDAAFASLRDTLPGQAPLIGKMKELWFYMGKNFENAERYLKEIRKAKDIAGYQSAVRVLFSQCSFF